jgi:hypothetical protein
MDKSSSCYGCRAKGRRISYLCVGVGDVTCAEERIYNTPGSPLL